MKQHKQLYSLQKEVEYTFLDHLTIPLLMKRMLQSAKRLWISTFYLWHRLTAGAFDRFHLSYFKLSLMAIAAFVFFKKDLHFQVRMKSPVHAESIPMSYGGEKESEQLSVFPQKLPFLGEDEPAEANELSILSQMKVETYIKRFAKVAIQEQQKFGVPASIKMAQAILESGAGTNATNNNHFGQLLANRNFNSAWDNWRAHSLLFAQEGQPYQQLLRYGNDYRSWAKGLAQLGYSDVENYDQALIQLIEQYEMYRLDTIEL